MLLDQHIKTTCVEGNILLFPLYSSITVHDPSLSWNCLFFRYGTESSTEGATTAITIGPISLTTHELFTSFMSSLILLPPLILITLLFAKAGPSPQKQKQSIRPIENVTSTNSNTNSNNNNDSGRQRWLWGPRSDDKQKKKKRHWPYWCRYIAWCLTTLAIAAAAFFTILYSFEFGGEKSRAWLVAFFLSFFQSVLLLQPVKVGHFLPYKWIW